MTACDPSSRLRAPVLLALALACTAAAPAKPVDVPVDIYVLAGQSNMSGRGPLADLMAAERVADPAITLYGNDRRWRPALDPLDDAVGQVDSVSADAQAAVGPGLTFARRMHATGRHDIALIPCAKGGSTIEAWTPRDGRDSLYGSCLARIRAAGGHLAGILWYQGESDARAPAAAARWSAAFDTLVGAFRRDLDQPRLPVVFVQIADKPDRDAARYPNWTTIQAAQATTRIACTRMVATSGLPRNPDELHLSTAAQRDLGARLATAMAGLIRQDCR